MAREGGKYATYTAGGTGKAAYVDVVKVRTQHDNDERLFTRLLAVIRDLQRAVADEHLDDARCSSRALCIRAFTVRFSGSDGHIEARSAHGCVH